jgi:predicted transcriptional regulator
MARTNKEHTQTFYHRVDSVIQMMLDNPQWIAKNRNDDLNEWIQNEFDVGSDMATKYIQEAKREYNRMARQINSRNIKKKRQNAIMDRESIARRARKKGDFKSELAALEQRDILEGIYITKTDIDLRTDVVVVPKAEKRTMPDFEQNDE